MVKKCFFILAFFYFINDCSAQFLNGDEDILKPIQLFADSLITAKKIKLTPMEVSLFLTKNSKTIINHKLNLSQGNKKNLAATKIYTDSKAAVGLVAMCSKKSPNRPIYVNPASAFAITSDGVCLTNYHVIYAYTFSMGYDSCGLFLVRLGNGKIYPLKKILGTSIENDIAVIQLDLGKDASIPFLRFENELPQIGEDAFVLGNPQGLYYALSKGIVSNYYSDNLMWPNGQGGSNRNLMAITADFAVGASGSPILNDKGNIIGMVSSTHVIEQNTNGKPLTQMVIKNTIPLSSLKSLLSSININ